MVEKRAAEMAACWAVRMVVLWAYSSVVKTAVL